MIWQFSSNAHFSQEDRKWFTLKIKALKNLLTFIEPNRKAAKNICFYLFFLSKSSFLPTNLVQALMVSLESVYRTVCLYFSFCLCVCLPVGLPTCLFVCLSTCLPACLSVYLFCCLSICLPISLYYMPACVCLSVYLIIYLSIYIISAVVLQILTGYDFYQNQNNDFLYHQMAWELSLHSWFRNIDLNSSNTSICLIIWLVRL